MRKTTKYLGKNWPALTYKCVLLSNARCQTGVLILQLSTARFIDLLHFQLHDLRDRMSTLLCEVRLLTFEMFIYRFIKQAKPGIEVQRLQLYFLVHFKVLGHCVALVGICIE